MKMNWKRAANALQMLAMAAPPGPWQPGRVEIDVHHTAAWVTVNHAKGHRGIRMDEFPAASPYVAVVDPHVGLALAGLLRKLPQLGHPMTAEAAEAADELAELILEGTSDAGPSGDPTEWFRLLVRQLADGVVVDFSGRSVPSWAREVLLAELERTDR